ncbi:copper transporter [Boudabousia marimammalium]|uniref:Copper transporter n=1 Tax=Boudabousia marimammalium TaxID=156892 RepID=A0A1Q5PR07_9ACTO|nr:copper transporter [Boudabousia marimammalium]OKL50078.1 hypothetical protein BM477_04130 [Boudabousia marimammalium]
MIDYRYHLTSLAAVFLALGIGVALGAGPLQATVSDALSGEVASVREQNANLNEEVRSLQADISRSENYLSELGKQVNHNLLSGYSTALLVFPGVASADVEKTVQSLTATGAQVSVVNLTEKLLNTGFSQYRSSLAPQLVGYLETAPSGDASTEEIMGLAVMTALADTDQHATLKNILTNPDNPLITLPGAPIKATSFVILTPSVKPETPAAQAVTAEEVQAAVFDYASLITPFASAPQSAVVLGDAQTSDAVLSYIRNQAAQLTTVDSFPSSQAFVSLPQALKTASTEQRAFGSQQGASLTVPTLTINTQAN